MTKGKRYPGESRHQVDVRTGAKIRQVTSYPSIHHHPFFLIPAYDDAMRWLLFTSARGGSPQIYVEERTTGELLQLTDRDDISDFSIYPSHDGNHVYFTARGGGWRVNTTTYEEELIVDLGKVRLKEEGQVGAAMGTTALSACDRWWAIRFSDGDESCIAVVDTTTGQWEVILRWPTVAHMQFCPDDASLLFFAGELTDRIWVVNRDGSNPRRLYEREPGQWLTHEAWIPGTRELGFVNWPHGMKSVHVDTGVVRDVASFNAWHAIANRNGTQMVADTNFPDIGIQLFDPRDGIGNPTTLCYPDATSEGAHWNGPFPYENGPIPVYAPQHTHPHPSFSPDGQFIVYTSDRSGIAQVYEVELP